MELAHTATDRIHQGIVSGTDSNERLMPILQPYNTLGTTEGVSVHTVRGVFKTNNKSHLSHVICDSGWEKQAAQALEFCPQVVRYVKNITPLDFRVPYVINGKPRHYIPDFIVQLDDGRGQDDLLNLVLEMSGAQRDDKDAKKATMDHYWVPAVNNCGQYGRWGFLDVDDPYMVMTEIEQFLKAKAKD
jgi:type III restriction enzyme